MIGAIKFSVVAVLSVLLLVDASPFYSINHDGTGKADVNSCAGRCGIAGTNSSLPCQCNPSCLNFGDCCSDFRDLCYTCGSGRDCTVYDTKWPCQCNSQCSLPQNNNCCPDKEALCAGATAATTAPPPGTVTDAELRALSNKLHTDDVNAVKGIVLDLQGQTTSGNTADRAPLPLFTSIPADALNGPTISRLVGLFKYYRKQASQTEVITPERTAEETAFLDAIVDTSVMVQAHSFLVSKGYFSADQSMAAFKEYLRTIWLGQYNRGGGIKGSSGLEHVFVGEISNGGISGYHNWVKYYLDEKNETMNYLGYITNIDLGEASMIEMPMRWENIYKSISSIAISSSPELDLAVATVCFVVRPNSKCPLQGSNGVNYAYQTYTLVDSGVTYVGSAYPTF